MIMTKQQYIKLIQINYDILKRLYYDLHSIDYVKEYKERLIDNCSEWYQKAYCDTENIKRNDLDEIFTVYTLTKERIEKY